MYLHVLSNWRTLINYSSDILLTTKISKSRCANSVLLTRAVHIILLRFTASVSSVKNTWQQKVTRNRVLNAKRFPNENQNVLNNLVVLLLIR